VTTVQALIIKERSREICAATTFFLESDSIVTKRFTHYQSLVISPTDVLYICLVKGKDKGLPQQVEVAQGVPDTLRSEIFLTFGTTRVVGSHPYAPAAFTPGEIPGTHFQRLRRPQGTWFRR
jgi:hypothetical protein